jgi:hypothetical protein
MIIRSLTFILLLTSPLISNLHGALENAPSLQFMPPMVQTYHPVSTKSFEAQESFNKGLINVFAYNHDLAFDSFEQAAKEDPNLAMAYWGMALALGQNINVDVTPENEIRAYELIQKALELSPHAWENEKAYIKALATRYTNEKAADLIPLRSTYRDAMKKVIAEYPEDLDAATLYAESILDLDPWKYWTYDGKPKEGTFEAIDILEFVLKRDPDHIGANHFYIHALEDSPYPERALLSAIRLENLQTNSGHLLHMPCHIFVLVGDYKRAVATSKNAIAADLAYMKIKKSENYPTHYFPHNLFVLSRVYMLMEDYPNAIKTANELIDFIKPHYNEMPNLTSKGYIPLLVYLYFHKWNEILNFQPAAKNPIVETYLHFSRAMAFTALEELEAAQKEKELMQQASKRVSAQEEIANNPAAKIFEMAELVLNGNLAKAQNNYSQYIEELNKAIEIQDKLNYDEPPAWYFPIQNELGHALLHEKQPIEAEAAFRKGLQNLQRNGRLLNGLAISLKDQERLFDAYWVERETKEALTP